MTQWLRRLTLAAAMLGALCFVGIEGLILYQLGGQFLPYIPRSADEFAGYCMAASAFLALAYTFSAGEHIRVGLLRDRLGPAMRRRVDGVALALAIGLTGYLAWHMCKLAWQSWQFDERSSGLIALPMWIPQAAMAFGAVVFWLAVIERGRQWRLGHDEDLGARQGVLHADR